MALSRLTKVDSGGISTTSDYRVGVITATKFVGQLKVRLQQQAHHFQVM